MQGHASLVKDKDNLVLRRGRALMFVANDKRISPSQCAGDDRFSGEQVRELYGHSTISVLIGARPDADVGWRVERCMVCGRDLANQTIERADFDSIA